MCVLSFESQRFGGVGEVMTGSCTSSGRKETTSGKVKSSEGQPRDRSQAKGHYSLTGDRCALLLPEARSFGGAVEWSAASEVSS